MKEKLKWLYKNEIKPDLNGFFLLFSLTIFTLLRLPSLIEPEWYGDEGIYQVIGRALLSGRLLYAEIWDNKPPLLYIYYALVNGDLFWIRFMSYGFGIGAIISFFYLSREIFHRMRIPVFISTFMLVLLFGLPLIEGNVANAENFILFPIIFSLFLISKLNSKYKFAQLVIAGAILSLAFLTKIVAIFDLSAAILILLCLHFKESNLTTVRKHLLSKPLEISRVFRNELILISSFLVPIILISLFFYFNKSFLDFIRAVFSQNIGYIGYGNYLLVPQGLLILKVLLLTFGSILIVFNRKKMGSAEIIIYSWLIFSLFNTFFSGRSYTHYVLVLIPAFCLLVGLVFFNKKNILINSIIVIIIYVLITVNFNFYTKIYKYYDNSLSFLMNRKSVTEYQAFFDKSTPLNYKIAQFIKRNTKKNDSVFLLSDSSTIYFLSDKLPPGRYIVEYHISFYDDAIRETQQAIDKKKPKYMIVTKERFINNFVKNYSYRYDINGVKIYEREF